MESWSASLYTATVLIPIFLAVLITRQAISPRLAIKTLLIDLVAENINIRGQGSPLTDTIDANAIVLLDLYLEYAYQH